MAKTKAKKQEIIQELERLANQQKVVLFVGISGLKSEEIFKLREKLREVNAIFKVAKKTLAEIAFKGKNIVFPKEEIKEPMGFLFGFQDEILPIKTIYQFQKEFKNLKIFGGSSEGQFLSENQIVELAKLPSKEELIARLIFNLEWPIYGFVNALEFNLKGLIFILKNIANKK